MFDIPKWFQEKLAQDPQLTSAVNGTLEAFKPWLMHSGMPFFPGFTDHSPHHINEVLKTASSLITDASRQSISAADIATLILATLLHDCGMHLTPDGFRSLIEENNRPILQKFGDKPWQQLWKDFLSEACRFNDEKLKAIFGDEKPIQVSEIDLENLDERTHLLIGEFVRRHHARLAHEIAVFGVPGPTDSKIRITGLPEDLIDIAGLIARSHGSSIRGFFEYLELHYGIQEYKKIKITYLMGVLRIADYVQVQSERAIASLLRIKNLRSPISRQEWKAHFAVADVTLLSEDPEAITVKAKPNDVKTFLKLQLLFSDIQRELDETWAVFGEVYGRYGDLSKLGLAIRRIKSNIDRPAEFAKTVDYLPVSARFESSGAELLKLLIGPLYSYDCSIGVRELIQNAVDACRELADLNPNLNSSEFHNQASDVHVELFEEGDKKIFRISDKGVGMTLHIINDFFLKAGASFRRSDEWRLLHTDDHGASRVLRGGRFGIGALAAFLLGSRIRVETRHYAASAIEGLCFEASVEDTAIELRKCQCPIGTQITIEIEDEGNWQKLAPLGHQFAPRDESKDAPSTVSAWTVFDWYYLDTPSLIAEFRGKVPMYRWREDSQLTHQQGIMDREFDCVPKPGDASNTTWTKLENSRPYHSVYWTLPPSKSTYGHAVAPAVSVNGISIQRKLLSRNHGDYLDQGEYTSKGLHFCINRPILSIHDPEGVCPINLQRNSISFPKMGLDHELAVEILNDFLGFAVCTQYADFQVSSVGPIIWKIAQYAGIRFGDTWSDSPIAPFAATNSGIVALEPALIRSQSIQYCLVVPYDFERFDFDLTQLHDNEMVVFTRYPQGIAGDLSSLRALVDLHQKYGGNGYQDLTVEFLPVKSLICLLPTKLLEFASKPGKVKRELMDALTQQPYGTTHTLVTVGATPTQDEKTRFEFFMSFDSKTEGGKFGYWKIGQDPIESDLSLLGKLWVNAFGHNVIPFDLSAMKELRERAAGILKNPLLRHGSGSNLSEDSNA